MYINKLKFKYLFSQTVITALFLLSPNIEGLPVIEQSIKIKLIINKTVPVFLSYSKWGVNQMFACKGTLCNLLRISGSFPGEAHILVSNVTPLHPLTCGGHRERETSEFRVL